MIRILTDSTADLTQAAARELGVEVVPLRVLFGQESYLDGVEMTTADFYPRLAVSQQLPTTSQPTPGDFLPYFQAAKDAGDSVVVVLISGALSGTVQSATIAKDMADYEPIYIIDSLTTITGLRLLVHRACALRDGGGDAREIAAALEALKHRVVLYAVVDTLEYLHKGGRLSRAGMVAGSLLNLKPIISVTSQTQGGIKVVGKPRGNAKSVRFLLDAMAASGVASDSPILFGYTATQEKLAPLREAVLEQYKPSHTDCLEVGSVVGTHAGPGAAAMSFLLPEPR